MSLILDALNRAEQERQEQNHAPSLQSVHLADEPARSSLRQRLHLERWLIALVVAYLVFDYFRSDTPLERSTPAPAAVPAAPVTAPKPQPQSVERATVETAPVATIETVPEVQREPVAAPLPDSVPDQLEASAKAGNGAVESLYRLPPAPVEQAAPEERASSPAAPAEAPPAAGRDASWAVTEEITDLPMDFRQQIPTLKYDNHILASQPADSRVELNGTIYREGDEIIPGLVLKVISTRGIVLEYQGTRFRLGAHNSWINFR